MRWTEVARRRTGGLLGPCDTSRDDAPVLCTVAEFSDFGIPVSIAIPEVVRYEGSVLKPLAHLAGAFWRRRREYTGDRHHSSWPD